MALADHADDDGTNCYPAVAYVAWKTGYSERQVRRIIRQLRDVGALIPIQEDQGPGRPVNYQVMMAVLPEKPSYQAPKRYLSPAARVRIIDRDQRACRYCGQAGTWTLGPDGQAWHIDRIIPASRGGTYADDNVALSCGTCNRKKGAKLAHPLGMPSGDGMGAISDPMAAVPVTTTGAIVETPKPSVTVIEPSGEPSVHSETDTAWLRTLRSVDGWGAKGEPHIDSLVAWVNEKGWTIPQLEAAAIGLADMADTTLKGKRDLSRTFQRRLNEGYDRVPVDGRGPSGDQGQTTSGRADGWDSGPA